MTLINLLFRDKKLDVYVELNVHGSNLSKSDLETKAEKIFNNVCERSILPNLIERKIENWRKTAIRSSITQHIREKDAKNIVRFLIDYKNGKSVDQYQVLLSREKIMYLMENSERIISILTHNNVIQVKDNQDIPNFKNIKRVAKYLTETIDGELLLKKHGESYLQLRASNKNELLQSLSNDSDTTGFFYQGKKELELMDKAFANQFVQTFFQEFSPTDCEMMFKAISHKLKAKGKNWDNGITADLIRECTGDSLRESNVFQRFADKFDKAQLEISIISQIKKENPQIFAELGLRNRSLQLFDLIGKDFIARHSKNIENQKSVVEASVLMDNSQMLNQGDTQSVTGLSGSLDNLLNNSLIDNYSFPKQNNQNQYPNFNRPSLTRHQLAQKNDDEGLIIATKMYNRSK